MLWFVVGSGGIETLASATSIPVSSDRCSAMDEDAFRELHMRTARPLWAYLARATGSASVADDLLQETYFRMLRANFEPENPDHERNFLFKVASNLVRDHFRSWKRREESLEEATEAGSPGNPPWLRRDVLRVFNRLTTRERQLLWLGHVEQFSHQEIAGVLGLKTASIRLLLFRARRKLASLLEEAGVGPEVLT